MSHVVLLTRGQYILIFYANPCKKMWKRAKNGLSKWILYVKIKRIFNFDYQSLIYFPLNYTNIQCLCPSMHFGLLSFNKFASSLQNQSVYTRCLVVSTDQVDPSCFYFIISWILMERRWFYFFSSPPFNAGPQKLQTLTASKIKYEIFWPKI